MKIKSKWTQETGNWDKATNKYINRKFLLISNRELEMIIIKAKEKNKDILKFEGGPTGYESYYISDLLKNNIKTGDMCICGGTINSWANCTVPKKEVFDFLRENGYENQ